jgi:hypothetical protein
MKSPYTFIALSFFIFFQVSWVAAEQSPSHYMADACRRSSPELMTQNSFLSKFPPGATTTGPNAIYGDFRVITRSCNAFTGCSAFNAGTAPKWGHDSSEVYHEHLNGSLRIDMKDPANAIANVVIDYKYANEIDKSFQGRQATIIIASPLHRLGAENPVTAVSPAMVVMDSHGSGVSVDIGFTEILWRKNCLYLSTGIQKVAGDESNWTEKDVGLLLYLRK